MDQIADLLAEKIHTLTVDQLAAVKLLVDSFGEGTTDRELTRAAMRMSEPSFAAVWDNPEDDVYNDL